MATSVEQPAWERMVRVSAGSTPAATDSISTAEGSGRNRLGLPSAPTPEAAAAVAAEDAANGNVDIAVAVEVAVEVDVSVFLSAPCSPQRQSDTRVQGTDKT